MIKKRNTSTKDEYYVTVKGVDSNAAFPQLLWQRLRLKNPQEHTALDPLEYPKSFSKTLRKHRKSTRLVSDCSPYSADVFGTPMSQSRSHPSTHGSALRSTVPPAPPLEYLGGKNIDWKQVSR